MKRGIGDAKYLNKRVPQNPKYQHVKTRLDTGLSLTKYMERLEEIKKNYRYKNDEIFKRIKITTFAQLVLQVASVSDLTESIIDEDPKPEDAESGEDRLSDQTNGLPSPSSETVDMAFSPRSTLQSVISGVGELSVDKDEERRSVNQTPVIPPSSTECLYSDCPYLLLDVRDRDLYDQCHIISAHSFPIATLSRTMNPYSKEVLTYRNAEGKIIILYDEDERMASQAATTMCERGFENLFMLSGGLKVIAQKFPEGLNTGSFPITCLQSITGFSAHKHAMLCQTPQPAQNKWRFTPEDLNKIQHYLDEVLMPSESSSRLSSRMSTSTTNSNVSSARSSRLSLVSDRSHSSRPWK